MWVAWLGSILYFGSLAKLPWMGLDGALDLPLFILNKSDSSPHLKNLYSHSLRGLLDVNMSVCVAFLSAQASEFESFWTGSNTRQLWQAGRPLITVNYLSGREAPKPPEPCSKHCSWGRLSACARMAVWDPVSGWTCMLECVWECVIIISTWHIALQEYVMLMGRQSWAVTWF